MQANLRTSSKDLRASNICTLNISLVNNSSRRALFNSRLQFRPKVKSSSFNHICHLKSAFKQPTKTLSITTATPHNAHTTIDHRLTNSTLLTPQIHYRSVQQARRLCWREGERRGGWREDHLHRYNNDKTMPFRLEYNMSGHAE